MIDAYSAPNLPDPDYQPEFYRDVTAKRFFAFVLDTVAILLITVLLVPFTAFTAIFYFGFLAWIVALIYRSVTIAGASATPGMWLMGIELRNHRGERLDAVTAFAHSLLFMISFSMVMPQVLSVILMLTTPRGQALHDLLLGTAMINRPART